MKDDLSHVLYGKPLYILNNWKKKKCCFGKLENLTLSWVFKCFPSCAESEKDILLNENASGKIPRQCEFYNVSLEFHF